MSRALKTCPTSGCPELVTEGRCAACRARAQQIKGTRQQRGYGRAHEIRFRIPVLRRDPICTCTEQAHGHGARCWAQATVADHYPMDKRTLRACGMDEHDPTYGRGVCKSCHDKHTASEQPGGWNVR